MNFAPQEPHPMRLLQYAPLVQQVTMQLLVLLNALAVVQGNIQRKERRFASYVVPVLFPMRRLLFVVLVRQVVMQYLVQAHVKHVLQENMQKEGLLNVKNVNQEQFPMPHHQVALFVRREFV